MPARIPEDLERITIRVRAADWELLSTLFPGKANEVMRDLLTRQCDALRTRLQGQAGSGTSI